jgi:hypothetical protein
MLQWDREALWSLKLALEHPFTFDVSQTYRLGIEGICTLRVARGDSDS